MSDTNFEFHVDFDTILNKDGVPLQNQLIKRWLITYVSYKDGEKSRQESSINICCFVIKIFVTNYNILWNKTSFMVLSFVWVVSLLEQCQLLLFLSGHLGKGISWPSSKACCSILLFSPTNFCFCIRMVP